MKEIKTHETVKDIRVLDRAGNAAERMRDAYIRTKDQAEQTQRTDAESPTAYADDRVTEAAQDTTYDAGHAVKRAGQNASRKVQEKIKDRASQKPAQSEPPQPQNASAQQPPSTRQASHNEASGQNPRRDYGAQPKENAAHGRAERAPVRAEGGKAPGARRSNAGEGRAPDYNARGRELARDTAKNRRLVNRAGIKTRDGVQTAERTVKQTAKTAEKSIKTSAKGTVKTAQKSIKTAEKTSRTAIKTTQATAKAAAKTAQATARAAQKAAQIARATAKAAATTAKAAAKAIAAAVKAIIAAVKGIVAAIAAGGWVAVLIIVIILLVAVLLCSVFGLFATEESYDGSPSMPEVVTDINAEFSDSINAIVDSVPHDTVVMDNAGSAAMVANWDEVLALYAVLMTTDPESPVEVATLDEAKIEKLRAIFWDMNHVDYATDEVEVAGEPVAAVDDAGNPIYDENGDPVMETPIEYETVLTITVTYTDLATMISSYGLNAEQTAQLNELLKPEYAELFLRLTGSYVDITLSAAEVAAIMDTLPEDLSAERTKVVLTAYSLLDKVRYFWGGKSLVIGWDSRWGVPMEVWADGSPTTGTMRPFGLDCSGFADWTFYNAYDGEYIIGHGGGAESQYGYCDAITWNSAQPGDLAFYPGCEHVGIVVKNEAGTLTVIHCASGYNNVVVTQHTQGDATFTFCGRPQIYGE